MEKLRRKMSQMVDELIRNPRTALWKSQWLAKSKGVTFTVTLERGDKLND
jgi:hypothetical protein